MTSPYSNQPRKQPQRRGFLASLSDALTPQPIPEHDDGPLKAPRGVIAATVLAIVAGLAYILAGGAPIIQINAIMASTREQYQKLIDDCTAQFGGFGTSAITETSASGSMATCQSMSSWTESDWDLFRSTNIVVGVVFVVMGVALVAAGLFLRRGAMWARRTIVAITIITVLAALVLGLASPLVLGATLLLVIAVLLCYLSTGATYFARVKARKHA